MKIDYVPDPSLYPFQPRWLDTYAGRLHYIDKSEGPAILFCHGNPTWNFLFRKIVTRLRSQIRCIAVDYLGFGLSDRPNAFRLHDRRARLPCRPAGRSPAARRVHHDGPGLGRAGQHGRRHRAPTASAA